MFVDVICMYAFNVIATAQMIVDNATKLHGRLGHLLLLSVVGWLTVEAFEIGFHLAKGHHNLFLAESFVGVLNRSGARRLGLV
jgi:hypothetical protein